MVLWELVAQKEPFAEFRFKFASQLEAEILKGLRYGLHFTAIAHVRMHSLTKMRRRKTLV